MYWILTLSNELHCFKQVGSEESYAPFTQEYITPLLQVHRIAR